MGWKDEGATLWEPSCRGAHLGPEAQELCTALFQMLSSFIEQKFEDPRREAIKLCLGHISASPFTATELESLRQQWASLLPSTKMALTVPERQPFLLGMIGQSLETMGGPDFAIYMEGEDSFWTGAVFPKKEKSRPLDDSGFNSNANNYKSVQAMAEDLEKKFREEEKLGRMLPTTLGNLKVDFPGSTPLVAAMGHSQTQWGCKAIARWHPLCATEQSDCFPGSASVPRSRGRCTHGEVCPGGARSYVCTVGGHFVGTQAGQDQET